MTKPATADKKPRRRWFAPRFSLKMLMFAMTALAIGSAIWWRWPVQRTQQTKLLHRVPAVNTAIYGTETTTYHRGWNGGLIQHGRRTLTYDGELYEDEMFQEGTKHGPARYPHGTAYIPAEHIPSDPRTATGEFFLGKKHGTWEFVPSGWKTSAPGKRFRSVETWHRGRRHGVFEWFDEAGQSCYRHEFKNDLLVDPEHNPTENLLLKRIAAGQLQDSATVHIIFRSTSTVYPGNKLAEVVDDLKERYGLMVAFRARPRMIKHQSKPVIIYNVPVMTEETNLPLYVVFDNILRPLDLVLDYRFGVLGIVDAAEAENWQDATGVMELQPSSATPLADRLDSPPRPTCLEPLRDALKNLAADQELPVEFRPAADVVAILDSISENEFVGLFREVVTLRNSPMDNPKEPLPITLRQLLGLILDQANLHCHEENGVLIIEPPQREMAGPSASVRK